MDAGPSSTMERKGTAQPPSRQSRYRRVCTGVNCPICGKLFTYDLIQAHADQCASKQDRPLAAGGADSSLVRQQHRRQSRARTSNGSRRAPSEPPIHLDVDIIDGFEFRSQARPLPEPSSHTEVHSSSNKTPRPAASTLLASLPQVGSGTSDRIPKASGSPARGGSGTANGRALKRDAEEAHGAGEDAFLESVREALQSEPHKLQCFTRAILDYHEGRSDAVALMREVAPVLSSHRTLLHQFSTFLPEGYRIEKLPRSLQGYYRCHENPESVTQEHTDQLSAAFVSRLVDRFGDRPKKLNEMYAALSAMERDLQSLPPDGTEEEPVLALTKMYDRMRQILLSDTDLWREFMQYVPNSCLDLKYVHVLLPKESRAKSVGKT